MSDNVSAETPEEDEDPVPLYIPPEFAETLEVTIWYGKGLEDGLAVRAERDLQDLSEVAADAYRRGYQEGRDRRSPPGNKYEYGPNK